MLKVYCKLAKIDISERYTCNKFELDETYGQYPLVLYKNLFITRNNIPLFFKLITKINIKAKLSQEERYQAEYLETLIRNKLSIITRLNYEIKSDGSLKSKKFQRFFRNFLNGFTYYFDQHYLRKFVHEYHNLDNFHHRFEVAREIHEKLSRHLGQKIEQIFFSSKILMVKKLIIRKGIMLLMIHSKSNLSLIIICKLLRLDDYSDYDYELMTHDRVVYVSKNDVEDESELSPAALNVYNYEKKMEKIKKIVITALVTAGFAPQMIIHNVTQILGWAYIFMLISTNLYVNKEWRFDHYYRVPEFRAYIEFFQTLQVLDVAYSITGLTNNSVRATLPQYVSRIFIVYGVFPYVKNPEGQFGIIICALMWSTIEVIRFSFYLIKQFKILSNSKLATFLGYIRYTTFIPVYPTGVAGELIAIYYTVLNLSSMNTKPFTINMPNKYNFAFDYQMYLCITPIFYLLGFPGLYMHMFRQRAKFIKEEREKYQNKSQKQD
ncbi:ptpla domain protein [Stylonychia lemnae]|uniref:very-long-chain (3R)-3-hydroxyacyl-CoA dehydratase n=1 Tax=Stylonychia lemnae TaxID=5949 RepID=A0A078B1B7_STYLE|nr:ptpla domain protein [Stylonychia lemnae]|eukprot:CDW86958.1 ptpla domain protein [Stylonychia lemnae]